MPPTGRSVRSRSRMLAASSLTAATGHHGRFRYENRSRGVAVANVSNSDVDRLLGGELPKTDLLCKCQRESRPMNSDRLDLKTLSGYCQTARRRTRKSECLRVLPANVKKKRDDERTRTADLTSLRVIIQ